MILVRRLPNLSRSIPAQLQTSTTLFGDDLCRLLPQVFHIVKTPSPSDPSLYCYTIEPTVSLYEIGIGPNSNQFGRSPHNHPTHAESSSSAPATADVATATATAFGPVSSTPLVRERPVYSAALYGWLGLAGATACCLTHTLVIPLDVVKTRAQTSSINSSNDGSDDRTMKRSFNNSSNNNNKTKNKHSNMIQSAVQIAQEEGISALLLGAQATLAGYFWYGLSVYPVYTFAKRTLSSALTPEWSMVHANELALVAGALAAVVASIGLTPLEAARIRAVADPAVYRPLGLVGTLQVIANENDAGAVANLYAGLPSLLTRQVIFGSVKFLAFERASEFIFAGAPGLRDAIWTTLAVSLVAGGLSGILSSVVSQPADCLLTYVAKGGTNIGLMDGARKMIMEEGPGSLFRGLGSRCVWAGSIIAGQFLLYDVFRTVFGVNADNLNQVFQLQV
jgi:solute carrier family 25 (mitochondrial phosphate transporter), member 3